MMFRYLAALSCLLFGIGCRSATNGKYQGEPLATLNGRMTLSDGVAVNKPIRLALAWFTDGDPLPSAIVSQDVTYEGHFPQNFTFNVYELPPAKAQFDWATVLDAGSEGPDGGLYLAVEARGFLIAYEDLNSDGQLTMSKGEPIQDRILGTTRGSVPYETLYAERTNIEYSTDPWTVDSFGSYFHLKKYHYPTEDYEPGDSMPLDAGVEIALVDNPRLGLYACVDTWEQKTQSDLACGLELATKPAPVRMYGYAEGENFSLYAAWDFAFHKVPNQKGSINGHPLTFGKATVEAPPFNSFTDEGLMGRGLVRDWLVPGANLVKLWSDDDAKYPPQSFEFTMAGNFDLGEPTPGPLGEPLQMSWTKSEGAVQYEVTLTRGDSAYAGGFTEDTSYVFHQLPEGSGPLMITVQARTSKYVSPEEEGKPWYVLIYETPEVEVHRMARKKISWP